MKSTTRTCQFFVASAFPAWKLLCFYVYGFEGLARGFTSSWGSLVVLAGYSISALILARQALLSWRLNEKEKSIEPLLFSALALILIWTGTNLNVPGPGVLRGLGLLGADFLMLYFCWRAGRRLPGLALTFWRWGFGINLARHLITLVHSQAQGPINGLEHSGPPIWIVTRLYSWVLAHSSILFEIYWIAEIVSSVFIAAGLILFVRRARAPGIETVPANTAKLVGAVIIALLLGLGISPQLFNSSGMIIPLALATVIAWCAIANRQLRLAGLGHWIWACGISLTATLIGRFRPQWIYEMTASQAGNLPRLLTGANLIASALWVTGTWLLLRRFSPASATLTSASDSTSALRIPWQHWRPRRVAIILVIGALAISVVWLRDHNLGEVLSPEPKFEGHTLTYYMQHWYSDEYGGHVNAQTMAALHAMGTNALPYLVKWIATPTESVRQTDYASRALGAFRILGPTAAPAIPDLIKLVGPNRNRAAEALARIGPAAIPALTNKLLESALAANTASRNARGGRRFGDLAQIQIVQALMVMDEDARPAIPALIFLLQHNPASDHAQAATALAFIGRRQPEVVVPALSGLVRGSSGQRLAEIVAALASFGTNASPSVPELLGKAQDPDPFTRSRVAAALKQIAPDMKNVLTPLIENMRDSNSTVRQQALYSLAQLGTNAMEALPALALTLRDRNPEIRAQAERCIQQIGIAGDSIILALSENLTNANASVSTEAASALIKLAPYSKASFAAVIAEMSRNPSREFRDKSRLGLTEVSRENPAWLLEFMEDHDPGIRSQALAILYELGREIPDSVPMLVKLLKDPDQNVRIQATNTLRLQSPTAARAAGIRPSWEH